MDEHRKAQVQRWMIRLADGDRSAFEPLFRTLQPLLATFARRSLRGATGGAGEAHEEAKDAAQEALLRVFARAHEFDRERDALNWILGITAYQCKTFRKRRCRRREDATDDAALESLESSDPCPEEELITRDLLAAAEEVLGTLRESDAATIRTAFLETERPAVAPATFRKRLQRALDRLRLAWGMNHGAL